MCELNVWKYNTERLRKIEKTECSKRVKHKKLTVISAPYLTAFLKEIRIL